VCVSEREREREEQAVGWERWKGEGRGGETEGAARAMSDGDLRKKESNEVARNSSPGDRRKGCRAKGESKRANFDAIEHQQPLCASIFSLNVFGVDRTPQASNVHKYSCTFALSFLLCSLLLELTCQQSVHVATTPTLDNSPAIYSTFYVAQLAAFSVRSRKLRKTRAFYQLCKTKTIREGVNGQLEKLQCRFTRK
jgi:hypothetical protein